MRLADKIREQLQEDEKKMQVPFTETEKQFWTTEIMDFFLKYPTHNFTLQPKKLVRDKMYYEKEGNYSIAEEREKEFVKWAENEGFVVKKYTEFNEISLTLPKEEPLTMTEQDKQLLLKDLCTRFPYGIK